MIALLTSSLALTLKDSWNVVYDLLRVCSVDVAAAGSTATAVLDLSVIVRV